jgi:hypothetical protein
MLPVWERDVAAQTATETVAICTGRGSLEVSGIEVILEELRALFILYMYLGLSDV